MNQQLDLLDQQIAAALIRNGRASWRTIGEVLQVPEHTAARRGRRLIADGLVHVRCLDEERLTLEGQNPYILKLHVGLPHLKSTAQWISAQDSSQVVMIFESTNVCLIELFIPPAQMANFMLDELASLPGVTEYSAAPILRYYRTLSGWNPRILSDEQLEALGDDQDEKLVNPPTPSEAVLDSVDQKILARLAHDGRATLGELSKVAFASPVTVGRRIERMREDQILDIRTVLPPQLFGFNEEAFLSVKCRAAQTDEVAKYLARQFIVRWVAAAGDRQVHAQVAAPSKTAIFTLLTEIEQLFADGIEASVNIVMKTFKRGGIWFP